MRTALRDPGFDASSPEGMLKSDPGLLYYITERILDAGGGIPSDFRADPRVQHPRTTDIPAEFTVGEEFLVAWARLLSGDSEPLHVFALRVLSFTAATFVVGAYLLVLARTRSVTWAALAALGSFLVAANYRTIGFILVREDLALPLFALHLGLLAHAVRRGRAMTHFAAGLLAAAALATWHAAQFLVVLELLLATTALAFRRRSLFELPGAWALALAPLAAGLGVPALLESRLLLGPLTSLALGLGAAAWAARTERPRLPWALAAAVAHAVLGALIGRGDAYSHVHQVLWAKLVHLGRLPADPEAIPFDARLLWQGPFETLPPGDLVRWLGWASLAVPLVGLLAWRARSRAPGFELWLALLWLASLPLAWAFGRLVALAGLLAVPVAAIWIHRTESRLRAGAALVLVPLYTGFFGFLDGWRSSWYQPTVRQAEIASVVRWVREHVPRDEPIVSDFMNSTALLAHAGNPICLQPKYETRDSRRRAEDFLEGFFHGTPAEFRRLLLERFQARYLLVDRYTLGGLSRYTAGLEPGEPLPATSPAARFLSTDPAVLEGVEGFELLYRSPPSLRTESGRPSDFFRLYRVE